VGFINKAKNAKRFFLNIFAEMIKSRNKRTTKERKPLLPVNLIRQKLIYLIYCLC